MPALQSGDLLATQIEYEPSMASLLMVEINLDVFLSLDREQSQVKVDLFRGLMWPLTPTSYILKLQRYINEKRQIFNIFRIFEKISKQICHFFSIYTVPWKFEMVISYFTDLMLTLKYIQLNVS